MLGGGGSVANVGPIYISGGDYRLRYKYYVTCVMS